MAQSEPGTMSVEVLTPKEKDLGGFTVRRLLPTIRRRQVGPFVFFDAMGATFPPGEGVSVRPHPHIGLATVTYLFEGAIEHRDSLGSHQVIRPGEINWMVAGRGIVHSERPPSADVCQGRVHGVQLWVALPASDEEVEPSFVHVGREALPTVPVAGGQVRVLLGRAFGVASPVQVHSPLAYADLELGAGGSVSIAADYTERAIFVASGSLRVDGSELATHEMAVLPQGASVSLSALEPARAVYIAGEPHPEKRFLDWNFVSTRRERIEQARADWKHERFPLVPGDEDERIPLPE